MKSIQYLFILLLAGITLPATAQVPNLNSYPAASATLFLDFDGQYLTGSSWNWSGPIDAQPAGLSSDAITEIFSRVAEDYRPFDLNVTTDSTKYWSAPYNKRMRIIVTPTWEWYAPAGGVSYVGSFSWGDNTPAFVFSNLLSNNTKYVAEAISHEAGHALGLQHQSTYDVNCIKTAEYSGGQGSGEIGWAPIMGVGYYENVTTWHVGQSAISCNIIQNDFDIIRLYNGFGLRADDHGDTEPAATDITLSGNAFIASGVINQPADIDVFKVVLTSANNLSLYATPQNVGDNNAGANIDIKLVLMNDTDTIGIYNPSTLLNAGVDTNLNAGTYYLVVDGVGNMYHNDNGSLGFYAVNGVIGGVLAVRHFNLNGAASNGTHRFSWSWQADEAITGLAIESSSDGQHFAPLTIISPAAKEFSYKPFADKKIYYRLKATGKIHTQGYYSNIIGIQNKATAKQVQVLTGGASTEVVVNSSGNFSYQLLSGNGQLLSKGVMTQGANHISIPAVKGLLLLHYSDGNNSFTEKFIK